MTPSTASNRLEHLRLVVRSGLILLILVSPLPFGSVQRGSVVLIEVAAAVLGMGALWVLHLDRDPLPRRVRFLAALSASVAAIGLFQITPLPQSWVRAVAGPTAEIRERVSAVVPQVAEGSGFLSLSPPDTFDALLRFAAYCLICLATIVAFRSRDQLKVAALTVAASGAFQAFYGSFEHLSGRRQVFGYLKKYYLEDATGTFVNRNHFAGYLAMTLPLALGLVLAFPAPPRGRGWRAKFLSVAEPAFHVRGFALLCVATVWIGVLLSNSRGGLAATIVGTIAVVVYAAGRRRFLWVLVVALALPTVFLLHQDVKPPGERMMALSDLDAESGRPVVWRVTAQIVADYPLLGSGYGTFEHAFLVYKPPQLQNRWNHAHNDWLEAASTGGIAAPFLFLAMLFVVMRIPRSRFSTAPTLIIGSSAVAGVLAIASHSVVDFCLRIPANAILLAFLVGLAVRATDDGGESLGAIGS